ncbi:2Fe-2S iron-sulfur cluster-binding protein [Emcibacter nanhaiensis]|uniref:2Fe-2S iron-sulfur cluster binding domain-containing protein n=1 Tax=Emcibacter nanhaiensis TaxID=1505037 RepID=A0A501PI53_9PROT|nr:2Fe-2S iron-sulfur cluster-binding protein [Emcibacter nanhaiensis]TPD59875.1 2Fe-2S iron-sulfur cluster binding domain-containing protein [Emcibacter nanhaiensis]
MERITVTFLQENGEERVLKDVETGLTLMEVGRDNGVEGIVADCGGCCDCGTCHVLVDEEWRGIVGPPNDIEASTLDLMVPTFEEGASRLSCQVELRPELDGLKVKVSTEF